MDGKHLEKAVEAPVPKLVKTKGPIKVPHEPENVHAEPEKVIFCTEPGCKNVSKWDVFNNEGHFNLCEDCYDLIKFIKYYL